MIRVTISNLDTVVGQLNDYRNSLAEKKSLFLERLAEEGIALIEANRENIIYDGDDNMNVDYTKDGDDGITIYAESGSITFIEFGSGVHQEGTHELASEFGFVRGTYGYGRGSRKAWVYRDKPAGSKGVELGGGRVLTRGNPPNRTVYQASRDLRQRVVEIAREVYGE